MASATTYDAQFEIEMIGDLATPAFKYFLWMGFARKLGLPKFECVVPVGETRPRPCGRTASIYIGNMEGADDPATAMIRHPSEFDDGMQFAIPVCERHMKRLHVDAGCVAIRRVFKVDDLRDQLWDIAHIDAVRLGPFLNDILNDRLSLLRGKQ